MGFRVRGCGFDLREWNLLQLRCIPCSEFGDLVGQQEDEEMLVPHTDLAKNNHQPMEGPGAVNFIIDHGELDFVFVQDRKVIHVEKGPEPDLLLVYGPGRSHLGFPAWRLCL
ncbi:hypothetical protein D0Y65_026874 [Glycine soja]|uniref:Uncharacterized protein n=1 Tax=Glycine soja TaxID=3848 RepID=A0A445ILM2_GLYSO|nr:hypothetical protein D0Y65_026874 [Glycine soja]